MLFILTYYDIIPALYNLHVNLLCNQGKYEEAIICCDKGLAINSKLPGLWISKGVALSELRRYDEAISCCDRALRLYPRHDQAWCNKGSILCEQHFYEAGISCFDKALEINQEDSFTLTEKGSTLVTLKRHEEATECLNMALKIKAKSDNSTKMHIYGWFEKRLGSGSFWLLLMGRIIGYEPIEESYYAKVWEYKAIIAYNDANYDEAEEFLNKAYELNPDYRIRARWVENGIIDERNKRFDSYCNPLQMISENYYLEMTYNHKNDVIYLFRYIDPQNMEGCRIEKLVDNKIEALMDIKSISKPFNFCWSPDYTKLILDAVNSDGENKEVKKFYIDIIKKKIEKIPFVYGANSYTAWTSGPDVTWCPDSKKIYYVIHDTRIDYYAKPLGKLPPDCGWTPPIIEGPDDNTLATAKLDGSDIQKIIKFENKEINYPGLIPSPDGNKIILTPYMGDRLTYLLDIKTLELNKLSKTQFEKASWSPDGSKILAQTFYNELVYSYVNNIYFNELNIHSYIDKTVWISNNRLIIAVPNSTSGVMNYIGNVPVTRDMLWMVDLPSGSSFPFNCNYINGVHSLVFNSDKQCIYFLNVYGCLYSLPCNTERK